ncbi:hypothetical protein EIN_084150 [Entamoeba invadens IP1]|uniref:hypothetical protein n=1 Tax=Entamoeba invadens IP1 TaxID=370355 RepID=UPI0002C3FBCD|nr:hypothetical protein EIN_084150 [Entamoeba invadens IP1]ELP85253.1 hypothetical protein EIN_084150 [Entamoeba invadens IP1]|eukprot:XP_004184599.1 hypothetical protein EIN_084150 [Entamoeba invadens IP1]
MALSPTFPPEFLLQTYFIRITSTESDPLQINTDYTLRPKDETSIANLMYFIYPDKPKVTSKSQILNTPPSIYSFVSTTENGKRYYYFVQRWVEEEIPHIIILVTGRYSTLYLRFLPKLQNVYANGGIKAFKEMVNALIDYPFPSSKENLTLSDGTVLFHQTDIPVLPTLFRFGVSTFVELVGRILLEETTMFYVNGVGEAMPVIQALFRVLSPFEWHGVLIPILPVDESFAGFAGCPTPMLFGVTPGGLKAIKSLYGDSLDINVIDLDNGKFTKKRKGLNLFAFKETGRLINQLQNIVEHDMENADDLICNCFSQLFLDLFGTYFAYYEKDNGVCNFNQEKFIKGSPVHMQIFLTAFGQSQMFERFIDHRKNYFLKTPDFRRKIFVDCPLFKSKEKPAFVKLRDIAREWKTCAACRKKIEMEHAVVTYGKNLVFHTECLRCKSCDSFIIGKHSFDRRCDDCEMEDIDEIANQYDNDERWKQADATAQMKKMEDSAEETSMRRIMKTLAFYTGIHEDVEPEHNNTVVEDMRETSLFFSGTTGSVFVESRTSKIGTFKAVLNPLDSRKTIINHGGLSGLCMTKSLPEHSSGQALHVAPSKKLPPTPLAKQTECQ